MASPEGELTGFFNPCSGMRHNFFTFVVGLVLILPFSACSKRNTTINNGGGGGSNNPPQAESNSVPAGIGATLITLSGSDPDNDPITFAIKSFPNHGSVMMVNANEGIVSYTPEFGFTGQDTFTFTVSDGLLESVPAQIAVNVSGNGGGSGNPPDAQFSWSTQGLQLNLDASQTYPGTADLDGHAFMLSEMLFRWDFDNDQTWDTGWLSSPLGTHTYSNHGQYTVRLQVQNPDGKQDTQTSQVQVNGGNNGGGGGGLIPKGPPGPGNYSWAVQAGVYKKNEAVDVAALDNGRCLVVGNARDRIVFQGAPLPLELLAPPTLGEDPGWIFMAYLDANGAATSLRTVSSGANDRHRAYAVTRVTDGYVVAGAFRGTIPLGSQQAPLQSSGNLDMFVIRYNDDHSIRWGRKAGGGALSGEEDLITDLAVDPAGRVWICGRHMRTAQFGSTQLTSQTLGNFVACYNPDGSLRWANSIVDFPQWLSASSSGCLVSGSQVQHYDEDGNASWSSPLQEGGPIVAFQDGSFAVIHQDQFQYNKLVRYRADRSVVWDENIGRGNWSLDRYQDQSLALAGDEDLLQFNPIGQQVWMNQGFEGSLTVDRDGNIFVAGGFDDRVVLDGNNQYIWPNSPRAVLVARFN